MLYKGRMRLRMTSIHSNGAEEGGGIYVAEPWQNYHAHYGDAPLDVKIIECNISGNDAKSLLRHFTTNQFLRGTLDQFYARGGGLLLDGGLILSQLLGLTDSGQVNWFTTKGSEGNGQALLEDVHLFGNRAYDGGGLAQHGFRNCTVVGGTISNNLADVYGGGVLVKGWPAKLKLRGVTISSNYARWGGGGLAIGFRMMGEDDTMGGAGKVVMTETLVTNNRADLGNGNNLMLQRGEAYYELPALAGYWLPNGKCLAIRPLDVSNCVFDYDHTDGCDYDIACSLTAGAPENNWMPSVCQVIEPRTFLQQPERPPLLGFYCLIPTSVYGVSPGVSHVEDYSRYTGNDRCKSPYIVQTCNWQTQECANRTDECLLGKTVSMFRFEPVDDAIPYACAAGLVGSSNPIYQGSSKCAGLCPSGHYCPTAATVSPLVCPNGMFCPEGSTFPKPCPAGTMAPAGLVEGSMASASQCESCPPGTFCPEGSVNATDCPKGRFNSQHAQEACMACAGGTYQDGEGKTACKACDAGSYCPEGAVRRRALSTKQPLCPCHAENACWCITHKIVWLSCCFAVTGCATAVQCWHVLELD